MKNFRPNKKGAYWRIHTHTTYWKWRENDFEYITFYPFPTFRLNYNGDVIDEKDYSFDIEFIWLFWEIIITRYWGEAYEKQARDSKKA